MTNIPADIGVQMDRALLDSLGHMAQCPATTGNLVIDNAKFYVDFKTDIPHELVNVSGITIDQVNLRNYAMINVGYMCMYIDVRMF